MAPDAERVAVVVLNWNGGDDTLQCLESLSRVDHEPLEVIVADNGSSDGSVATIRGRFPAVTVLENGRNLGFAEGNNTAVRVALDRGADFVMLLNNDAVIDPPAIRHLLDAAKARPAAGVFGPKIYYHSDPRRIWFAGATWRRDTLDFRHHGLDELDSEDYAAARDTDYVTGCALMFRASVARRIGLLDRRFFLYYEETDWCFRARRAGFSCLLVPDAKVWHKVSASFGEARSAMQVYFGTRNFLLWAERNLPFRDYVRAMRRNVGWVVHRVRERMKVGSPRAVRSPRELYWFVSGIRRKFEALDPETRLMVLGTRDYFLRRFGDCPAEVRRTRIVSESTA